ncbi:MAG: ThiF family adenylyltransferase [Pseudomonadota bacterium]
MHNIEYSVAMTKNMNSELTSHLIRDDHEEDLIFALYSPSHGSTRLTGLIHTPIYPEDGDRQRHGNASFNPRYFEKVCKLAMEKGAGIAFIHSHPFPGWQDMSHDDVVAENKMMGAVAALTELPLLGMTVSSDSVWSARFWTIKDSNKYERKWCSSVRVIGKKLTSYFNNILIPKPAFTDMFSRTVTVWGETNHTDMARLKVGIVGLGSVGGAVAMCLARMGLTRLVFIDHDEIQMHNLDRLEYATQSDLGFLKVDVAKREALKASTASSIKIDVIPYSVAEKQGYSAALDCDVLFSCVDRPRPRAILNHFAYAHLIPAIDGGIDVRFKNGQFSGVDWQLQTVGPERTCLECIGAFTWDDVSTEIEGKLDDPSYISGLPELHRFRRNENVYPFSQNLASLETLQFVALTTACGGYDDFGIQRYRYNPGILVSDTAKQCHHTCKANDLVATGDTHFKLYGRDLSAEAARERQR